MRDPMTSQPTLPEDLIQLLPRIPLFRGLTMPEIRLVAAIAEEIRLEPGEFLTHAGDVLDAVYVLCEGEAELLTGDGKRTRPVLPSEDYGLVSLVEPRRVTQGHRAVQPTRFVRISADAFHVLMDSDTSIGLTMWRNIARLQTYHFMQLVDRWAGVAADDRFNPYMRGL
ncbi:MAG: cyclic nucleotide-binding domain-containing protein [Dehalococcoidia bacterium]